MWGKAAQIKKITEKAPRQGHRRSDTVSICFVGNNAKSGSARKRKRATPRGQARAPTRDGTVAVSKTKAATGLRRRRLPTSRRKTGGAVSFQPDQAHGHSHLLPWPSNTQDARVSSRKHILNDDDSNHVVAA